MGLISKSLNLNNWKASLWGKNGWRKIEENEINRVELVAMKSFRADLLLADFLFMDQLDKLAPGFPP